MQTRRQALISLTALVAACTRLEPATTASGTVPTPRPRSALPRVLISGVPHVRQKPDFCGEAVTASWAGKLGANIGQDQVFNVSGMDPARGMGLTTRELSRALAALGFTPGPVWYQLDAADPMPELERRFAELHADLLRGVPSIVCTRFDESENTSEHFRLVLGYEPSSDEVVYHDPALDSGAYLRMSRGRFLALWPLKYERERWTLIRLALRGESVVEPPRLSGYTPADFAQHVMRRRPRLTRDLELVVEPPFLVLGDGGLPALRRSAEFTVRWAVSRLKRDFFSKDPARILDIFLFKDAASYESHALELFGEQPSTPYGYYSSEHAALVMNIATGGGTLVHEIVHPFIEANFPSCPAWFNEGLGSLFEQSAERQGHIVGLTNWRLAGLQRALRRGTVPSFSSLTATTARQFYDDDPGTNYAQARYLLYYLQEHGLLVRYYHAFLKRRAKDPTGYATLQEVLGEADMAQFQRRWARYVLGLRFG